MTLSKEQREEIRKRNERRKELDKKRENAYDLMLEIEYAGLNKRSMKDVDDLLSSEQALQKELEILREATYRTYPVMITQRDKAHIETRRQLNQAVKALHTVGEYRMNPRYNDEQKLNAIHGLVIRYLSSLSQGTERATWTHKCPKLDDSWGDGTVIGKCPICGLSQGMEEKQ